MAHGLTWPSSIQSFMFVYTDTVYINQPSLISWSLIKNASSQMITKNHFQKVNTFHKPPEGWMLQIWVSSKPCPRNPPLNHHGARHLCWGYTPTPPVYFQPKKIWVGIMKRIRWCKNARCQDSVSKWQKPQFLMICPTPSRAIRTPGICLATLSRSTRITGGRTFRRPWKQCSNCNFPVPFCQIKC